MRWQRSALALVFSCAWSLSAEAAGDLQRIGPGFNIDLDPFKPAVVQVPEFQYLGPGVMVQDPWQSGVFPVWGLHASMPQIVDVTLGVVVGKQRHDPVGGSVMLSTIAGALIAVRPGWAGTAVDIGYASVITSPDDSIHAGIFGYSLRVSLLRTYGEPLQVEGDQTFVGIVASLHMLGSLMVGGYLNVNNDHDDQWLFSLGFGFGL